MHTSEPMAAHLTQPRRPPLNPHHPAGRSPSLGCLPLHHSGLTPVLVNGSMSTWTTRSRHMQKGPYRYPPLYAPADTGLPLGTRAQQARPARATFRLRSGPYGRGLSLRRDGRDKG